MMIDHVLAVSCVTDMDVARPWYERLLGRPPTNEPMATLCEWRVTASGWLQVFVDGARAGSGYMNFAVDDLDGFRADLVDRGLDPGVVVAADKGVRLCSIDDPDGNRITWIGGFRVDY